jgi:hypothetical protein
VKFDGLSVRECTRVIDLLIRIARIDKSFIQTSSFPSNFIKPLANFNQRTLHPKEFQSSPTHFCPFIFDTFSIFLVFMTIFLPLTVVRPTMPLRKGSSPSLPSEIPAKDQHPLKRKQPLSFDDRSSASSSTVAVDLKPLKNRLIRSDESPLLTQTPIEVLLDLLKQFSGVKEISEETQVHLFMVKVKVMQRGRLN